MDKLMCPLGDEQEVSEGVIKFLENHYYVDVFKDDKYLFTLKRLKTKGKVPLGKYPVGWEK